MLLCLGVTTVSEWPNYVEVAGSYEQMGSAHGEQCRERIRELAELRINYLVRSYGAGSLGVIKAVSGQMANEIERNTPAVYMETTATARAANVAYWMLVVAGALSDIDDLVSRVFNKPNATRPECTLIPARLAEGAVILSGTWDTHADAARYHLVLRRDPIAQPATLALTTFGWPMQQGVTSAGLAFAITNLVARTAGTGIPYIAVLPAVAACHTFEAALRTLRRLPHCSGRFYAMADESTYSGIEIVPGVGAFTTKAHEPHTNHYVNNDARQWEGRPDLISASVTRLVMAGAKAGSARTIRSAGELLQLYEDRALTQHGRGDADRTGATFVVSPSERVLYIVSGAPEPGDVSAVMRRYAI
jgi:hypothetical protein